MRFFKIIGLGLSLVLLAVTGMVHAHEDRAWAKNINSGQTYTDTQLQQAFDEANSGNIIKIHGRFVGPFTISQNLTVKGVGFAELDGNQAGSTLTINDTEVFNVQLINLTIKNGLSNNGGGINNPLGTLTLRRVSVIFNTANEEGGGIFNGGTLTIYNSKINDNTSNDTGGGIGNDDSGLFTIVGSEINRNTAVDFGAGIYNNRGNITSTVSFTEIAQNSTPEGHGGGIYTDSTIALYDVLLKQNEAFDGGGFYNDSNAASVFNNSSLIENFANDKGGGAFINSGSLAFILSEVKYNEAEVDGGGILLTSVQHYLQLSATEVEHNSPNNIGLE